MLYMLSQMVFGALFVLCIKWVQRRQTEDMVTVGMVNYIAAAIAILPVFLMQVEAIDWPAVGCGADMGLTYFIAVFFATYAVATVGASNATVISVLSITIPIICGVFIWSEIPNAVQVAGVGMALISLILIGTAGKSQDAPGHAKQEEPELAPINATRTKSQSGHGATWKMPVVMVVFFLLCGNSRLAQEMFKHMSLPEYRPTYLAAAFITAAIPSIWMLIIRGKRIRLMETVLGTAMGLVNLLQTYFILKALQFFEAFVVFPVTSAGALLLTTFVATCFLGERLNRRAYAGIAIAAVALFLLYWLPSN